MYKECLLQHAIREINITQKLQGASKMLDKRKTRICRCRMCPADDDLLSTS